MSISKKTMKKTASIITALLLTFNTFVSAAPSFGGSDVQNAADSQTQESASSDGVPDFEDDFSMTNPLWGKNDNFTITDGAAKTDITKVSRLLTYNDNWESFNLECDFTIT